MFGLSIGEIILIAVVALVVLGPRKLPEVGRQLGLLLREIRRAGSEIQTNLHDLSRQLEEEAERKQTDKALADPTNNNAALEKKDDRQG